MRLVTSVRIGLNRCHGKLSNYAKRYGALELDGNELPPTATLRKWRKQVPPSFAFSILLPSPLAALGLGPAADEALERVMNAAKILQASALVLATPTSVRPTSTNIERIGALAAKLHGHGQHLAWEPSGIWTPEEVARVAAASGWLPVVDGAEHDIPSGAVVYTRLRAIGKATRLGPRRLRRLAAQLAGRREAFVIANPVLGPALAANLSSAIDQLGAEREIPMLFKPSSGAVDFDFDAFDEEQ